MENIPGYDSWKTTPPDDPDPVAFCDNCDTPLYKGDSIYMHINEENLCEVCMNDMYRRIL